VTSVRILAISGSLRKQSLNSALLRAAAQLSPQPAEIIIHTEVGHLPLFNPDLEDAAPPVVRRLWDAVAAADALLIASPEYAHGVTGTMKNVLDWLVGLPAFYGKPVAVLNASPRARHADEALRETLRTMSATIVEEASISIPILGSGLDEAGMIASAEVSAALRVAVQSLCRRAGTAASEPVSFGGA
jgi:chromate reductase, NAD(P)H dehydrogenase (quinone)